MSEGINLVQAMQILVVIAGITAGIHAYSYGKWLREQKRRAGAALAFALAAGAAILPIYRMLMK